MDRVVLGKNAQGTDSGFWVSKPGVNALAMTEPTGTFEEDWYGYQVEFDWDGSPEPAWSAAGRTDSESGVVLASGGAAFGYDRLIRSANGSLLIAGRRNDIRGSILYTKRLTQGESATGDPTAEAFIGSRYSTVEMKIRLVPPLEIDGSANPNLPSGHGSDFNLFFETRPIENHGVQTGRLSESFMRRGHAYEYTGTETLPSGDTVDQRFLSANTLYINGDRNLTLGNWTNIFKDEPEIGSSANDWKILEWDMTTMVFGPQLTTQADQTTYPTHNGNPAISQPYSENNPFGVTNDFARILFNPWFHPQGYMMGWEQLYFVAHPGTYLFDADADAATDPVATSLATSAPFNPHPENSQYRITQLRIDLNLFPYTGNVTHDDAPPMWEIDYVRVKKPNVPKDAGAYGNRQDSMLFNSDWDATGLVHQTGYVVIGTQKGNIDGSTSANLFSDTVKETSNGVVHFDALPYIPLVIFQRIDPDGVVSYPGGEKEFSMAATEWEDHTYPKTNVSGRNVSQTGYDLRLYTSPAAIGQATVSPEWNLNWPYHVFRVSGHADYIYRGFSPNIDPGFPGKGFRIPGHDGLYGSKISVRAPGNLGGDDMPQPPLYPDANLNRYGRLTSDGNNPSTSAFSGFPGLGQHLAEDDYSSAYSWISYGMHSINYPLASAWTYSGSRIGARDEETNDVVGWKFDGTDDQIGTSLFGDHTVHSPGIRDPVTAEVTPALYYPTDTGWDGEYGAGENGTVSAGDMDHLKNPVSGDYYNVQLGPYSMEPLPWKTNISDFNPSVGSGRPTDEAGTVTIDAQDGTGFAPSKRAGNNFANQISTFYEARTFAYVRAAKDHFNLTCRNATGNEGLEPVLNLAPTLPEEAGPDSGFFTTGGSANQGSAAYGDFYERLGPAWEAEHFPRRLGGMAFRNDNGNWGMFHPAFTLYDDQPFSEGLMLRANTVTTANTLFLNKTGTLPAVDGLASRYDAFGNPEAQLDDGTTPAAGLASSAYRIAQHIPESTFDQYKWHPSFCCHPLIFNGELASPSDDPPTYQANDVYAATQGEVGFPDFNPENGMYAGSTGGFYPYRYHREEKTARGAEQYNSSRIEAFTSETYYWYEYEIKRLSSPGITHPAGVVPESDDAFDNRNGATWAPDPGENYWTDVVANDSGSARVLNQTAYIGGARNKKRNPQSSVGVGPVAFPRPAFVEYNEADAKPPTYKYWVLRVPMSIEAYTSTDPEFF